MYKLTAICPPDMTKKVKALLQEEPETSNIVTMQAVVADAEKDVVTAFVRREATDVVIGHLRTLRQWDAGELSFIEVDLEVHRDLKQLDEDEEDDTIGWEMVLNLAHAESRLTWWYLMFMAVAGLIAAVGLIQNLPVLLVGAMSLSPDLAPTNSIAVALTAGAFHDFRRSLRTLALGLGAATAVAFLFTLILELTGVIESGTFYVSDHLVTFVTVVNVSTVIVALAAGVAAMVAFVTGQARGAVGVAISVTTIPAAAYAGIALADRSLGLGAAAIGVLLVNVVCLTLAQILTLVIVRAWRGRKRQPQPVSG